MKRVVFLLTMFASLSSCKSYMVSTVASKNTVQNPETGKFNMVNDSLAFTYSFSGTNMPLNVEVFNKLKEPLFVDWERSALVIGETTYSFVDDNVHLTADVSGTAYNNLGTEAKNYYGEMRGTAQISNRQSFIPPGAKITRSIYALNDLKEIKLAKSEFRKVPMDSDVSTGVTYVSTASFTEMNSPLKFKSFITVFTLKDNSPQSVDYQHEFYISRIAKTGVNPSKIILFNNQKDANIVNENRTGFAKTLISVGVVGLAGAAIAGDAMINKNADNQQ